ncbi:MAG: hypothetical protein NUW21_13380 [Elusimicrobia bacterium]|nr:hypothetical protein [Elusimicrobiota bacterium]
MKVEILPATLDHALDLAPRLRAEDAAEVLASSGRSPFEALAFAVAYSDEASALLFDGEVACLYGVAAIRESFLGPPVAWSIWLLGSDALRRHRRTFVRLSREVVAILRARYAVLFNFVDARYVAALRWAEWLGFEVGEPRPYGVAGLPFRLITLSRGG